MKGTTGRTRTLISLGLLRTADASLSPAAHSFARSFIYSLSIMCWAGNRVLPHVHRLLGETATQKALQCDKGYNEHVLGPPKAA